MDSETPEELRARGLLEQEFGCPVVRVAATHVPTVDYRTPDASVGIEVKRITNAAFNDLTAAFRRAGHCDSDVLTGRWTVMIDRPTLSTSLGPMPAFPEDNEALIAELESSGMTVQRQAEREVEWRQEHPGPALVTPRLVNIGRDLEPHLLVLEQHNIKSTRDQHPYGAPSDLAGALIAIAHRTAGAMCTRQDPLPHQQPGLDVVLVAGYARSERADTIVGRIDLWLTSGQSKNLRESLANEHEVERHAVLVFDASTEPEYYAAVEQGVTFCPQTALVLPEEIDVLWFILGPVACRYCEPDGWRASRMPEIPGE